MGPAVSLGHWLPGNPRSAIRAAPAPSVHTHGANHLTPHSQNERRCLVPMDFRCTTESPKCMVRGRLDLVGDWGLCGQHLFHVTKQSPDVPFRTI